ncbi:J domain-containing protein [Methylobacterium planeticum]|uniref:DnaJ domain-containing protein n=1 Tax=Methylobacterium planeticum TaxID=2615211 RepID=A0A6N6MUN9_9HYPH|nr:DnaJ domain-containing protein [Methylobacterium planeticum]KAB1073367.1 DnaJ domain-containing protein [Methylobacterium planeticum]
MALALGLLACLALWWFSKNGARFGPALTGRLLRRVAAWGALVLAAFFLLRGRIDLALVLGLGGVWLLEGPENLGRRLRGVFKGKPGARGLWGAAGLRGLAERLRPAARPRRSPVIELAILPDGSLGPGFVRAGPLAGEPLDRLAPDVLRDLLGICRLRDPEGARLLEAYLDGRHPGWRVDAQRDADARARRPADPGAMTQDEAYEVLGLQRGASPEEIRTAHRALMKRLHPDQGGTAERAARVNAARDRLTNRHR